MFINQQSHEPSAPVARLTGIVKRYGQLRANYHINFSILPGEIHALVGENGAGKSTLMNILAGVLRPDAGGIELFGHRVDFHSPRDAIRLGVGMVHQHFAQVPSCTVAEHFVLADPDSPFLISRTALENKVASLCETYGFALNPRAVVDDLSVGERQKLELLRLLAKDASILILDEPTAVLTPKEVVELFQRLRRLADQGRSVVLITHKLDEVAVCADRVTVLRQGRVTAAGLKVAEQDMAHIAALMVGEAAPVQEHSTPMSKGDTVFVFRRAYVSGDAGAAGVCGVDLEVRAGEILAIAGVAGNGQRELAEAALGLRRLKSGTRLIFGQDATRWPAYRTREMGVGYVPEDRLKFGLCPNLSVADNLNLNSFNRRTRFFLSRRRLTERAQYLAEAVNVKYQSIHDPVRALSGGNLQKVILAREIAAAKLLVVAQPTRGLDLAAAAAVHAALIERRQAGAGILLISYDLDEILALADRLAVMVRGCLVAAYEPPWPDRAVIGLAMAGGKSIAL